MSPYVKGTILYKYIYHLQLVKKSIIRFLFLKASFDIDTFSFYYIWQVLYLRLMAYFFFEPLVFTKALKTVYKSIWCVVMVIIRSHSAFLARKKRYFLNCSSTPHIRRIYPDNRLKGVHWTLNPRKRDFLTTNDRTFFKLRPSHIKREKLWITHFRASTT